MHAARAARALADRARMLALGAGAVCAWRASSCEPWCTQWTCQQAECIACGPDHGCEWSPPPPPSNPGNCGLRCVQPGSITRAHAHHVAPHARGLTPSTCAPTPRHSWRMHLVPLLRRRRRGRVLPAYGQGVPAMQTEDRRVRPRHHLGLSRQLAATGAARLAGAAGVAAATVATAVRGQLRALLERQRGRGGQLLRPKHGQRLRLLPQGRDALRLLPSPRCGRRVYRR